MTTTDEVRAAIKRECEKRGMKYVHTELRESLGGHTALLSFGPLRPAPPPRPPAADFKDAGANI